MAIVVPCEMWTLGTGWSSCETAQNGAPISGLRWTEIFRLDTLANALQ